VNHERTRQELIRTGHTGELSNYHYFKDNHWSKQAGKGDTPRPGMPIPEMIVMRNVCSLCKQPYPRLITIPGRFKDRCPHCTDKPAAMG